MSRLTPTAQFSVTSAPAHVPWHSWATSASHGTSAAVKSARVAARVLAISGAELLTDPDLLARARAAFQEAMQGKTYESPLPPDQAPPVPEEIAGDGGR